MRSRPGAQGKTAWEKHFAKYRPINMGNSGDITPAGYALMAESLAPVIERLLKLGPVKPSKD